MKHSANLPKLVELPVYRDAYCSQEVTDQALSYLWSNRPDLVCAQAVLERGNFDNVYVLELASIVEFFRNEASKHIEIPNTRLGMLDLLFEMSRRLRLVLDIPAWDVRGKSLAESENGPMPDLPSLPIETLKGRDDYFGLTQEIADRIITDVYRAAPDLFFEKAECLRRGSIWPWDIINALKEVISSVTLPEDRNKVEDMWMLSGINREITYRLADLCEIKGVIAGRE